jgi:hypothetical protein
LAKQSNRTASVKIRRSLISISPSYASCITRILSTSDFVALLANASSVFNGPFRPANWQLAGPRQSGRCPNAVSPFLDCCKIANALIEG